MNTAFEASRFVRLLFAYSTVLYIVVQYCSLYNTGYFFVFLFFFEIKIFWKTAISLRKVSFIASTQILRHELTKTEKVYSNQSKLYIYILSCVADFREVKCSTMLMACCLTASH